MVKYLAISLTYIAFFGLIGAAVYFANSGWPLLALVFAHSFSFGDKKVATANDITKDAIKTRAVSIELAEEDKGQTSILENRKG